MLKQILKPGDRVDIIAPASGCHPGVLKKVEALLTSWQLQSYIPENLLGDDFLFANKQEHRLEQLQKALQSPQSRAVWCLLGGYGSGKLLPELGRMIPPKTQKIFLGFSDITALHIFLQVKWGWSTIHTPSARQVALGAVTEDSSQMLHDVLFGKTHLVYENLAPLNHAAKKNAVIAAPIIGGNLHLIQASIGTSWQIDAKNKILFIEDVNERAYRIDRALEHLKQANILNQTAAILLGDFIGGKEVDGTSLVDATLKRFAETCPIPVLQLKHVGHGKVNYPLILGQPVKLQLGKHGTLDFDCSLGGTQSV
ncbi:MAG: LD-carboxypeptidase [Gammaproteobacteria bacterium]|nr:LD-carboxypeptidase [Gammaproteobacteria bacterium]